MLCFSNALASMPSWCSTPQSSMRGTEIFGNSGVQEALPRESAEVVISFWRAFTRVAKSSVKFHGPISRAADYGAISNSNRQSIRLETLNRWAF